MGEPLLSGAHRVVRTFDAKEGPFAGVLVTHGDGVCVRVDASVLGGWVGWRFAGAEHVAAPIDVCRRRGGHEVLLPWCTDRVVGYLVRRTAGDGALSAGECSTLVISLLRGLDELGEGAEGVRTGAWWLTDGGRPVFVLGEGPDARAAVVELLVQLREHITDKVVTRAIRAIEEGLRKTNAQPRLPRRLLETWETELLNVAAPQPLKRGAHAPARATDVARAVAPNTGGAVPGGQRLRVDRARARARDSGRVGRGAGFVRAALSGVTGAVVAQLHELGGRLPRRLPSATPAEGTEPRGRLRRRSFIVSGGVAAVVLVGGLLWPGDDVTDASGDAAPSASHAPSRSANSSPGEPSPPTADVPADDAGDKAESGRSPEEDPATAASSLVEMIAACHARDDATCPEAVAAGSVGVVDALAAAGARAPTAELVDEYGDVAVVRLDIGVAAGEGDDGGAAAPTQMMVVLIRVEDKWLVRDVYDVADQPG